MGGVSCLFALWLVFLFSCRKDDPKEVHEHEVITRVTLDITEKGSLTGTQTVAWEEDGEAPAIVLEPMTAYEVTIGFYDASAPDDVEDITPEVIEEADEHFVFFDTVDTLKLRIESADGDVLDSQDEAVQIHTRWTTGEPSSGTLRVYLIHQPATKTATTRDGFRGETDVEVDFPIAVQ